MDDRLRIIVIVGSIRAQRFGPTAAAWITEIATEREEFDVEVLDLAEADLPHVLGDGVTFPQRVLDVGTRLAAADGFVVVTPEYNHSVPGSLKNGIDWFVEEWRAKPVAFVSYGAIAGGLRSVQHLRQIFSSLEAFPVRDTVSFHNYWEEFDENGAPLHAKECGAAADNMLDQLNRWARVLRDARRAENDTP